MNQPTTLSPTTNSNEQMHLLKPEIHEQLRKLLARIKPYGIYSCIQMNTAGFRYTGENDTVICDICKLEVSNWTKDMIPFTIHLERSPQCSFIRSRLLMSHSELNDQENPPKRQKTDSNSSQPKNNFKLIEVKTLQRIRRQTFSHWSRRTKPSTEQLIAAGFFGCNVGDRVICLYCNLICQQWTSDTDDPSEVHKTLSPRCPYVLSMLMYPEFSPTLILNDISTNNLNNQAHGLNNMNEHRFDQIVYTRPCHAMYSDITKRHGSFATWSQESAPPVDELVRAGFFYSGTGNVVTCFYCGGSLQNWGTTDNPINEHARWFGQCPYAKQLCGDELHRKIQEANRARQERERANQMNQTTENSNLHVTHHSQLQIDDPNMLSRFVAARLDLSSSQHLLDQPFKLSVIKRCWEDQLQLKKDDFLSDSDLLVACMILQKQIDHIQGNKDNIIIPRERMRLIREQGLTNLLPQPTSSNNNNNNRNAEEVPSNQSVPVPIEAITTPQTETLETNSERTSSLSNPCIICFQDEKRLACIPCGHFTACVPCSHSLRTCPVCRRGIEAFVRIYI